MVFLFSKEILEDAGLTGIAVDIAGMHHERLDGKGYPFGKKGDEISQYVRMASIVDVYDALTAERVYKAGMEPIKAFKILKQGWLEISKIPGLRKFLIARLFYTDGLTVVFAFAGIYAAKVFGFSNELVLLFAIAGNILEEPYFVTLATKIVILGIAGMGLNLALGYGGLVSFGHAAFFGMGGYISAISSIHFINGEPIN